MKFFIFIALVVIWFGCSKESNPVSSGNLAVNKIIKSQSLYQIIDTIKYFDTATNTFKDSIKDSLLCTWYYDSNGVFILKTNSSGAYLQDSYKGGGNCFSYYIYIPLQKKDSIYDISNVIDSFLDTAKYSLSFKNRPDSLFLMNIITPFNGQSDTLYNVTYFTFNNYNHTTKAHYIHYGNASFCLQSQRFKTSIDYTINNVYW